MQNKSRAFTLIELLVVVLIIGILAAVAVPQYQLAVDKTRLVQLLPLARAIKNAQETFYLANGRYAETWEELGFDLPPYLSVKGGRAYSYEGDKNLRVTLYNDEPGVGIGPYKPDFLFIWSYDHCGTAAAGKITCYGYDDYARKLLKTICTKDGSSWRAKF